MSAPAAVHRTKDQERINELANKVRQLMTELKKYRMAEAFARWDANHNTKPNAGKLMQDYSAQYDEDMQLDLPELFGGKE